MLMAIFHLSVFLLNLYTSWYDQKYVDLPFPNPELENTIFKGRTSFFTFWCFMLQTMYFGVAFLNDILGTNSISPKKTPLVRKTRDVLFTVAFPWAIYVSSAFWAIYSIDKELIFPERIANIFPVWINHLLHTFVTIFIILELVASFRNYPSKKIGMSIMIVLNSSYAAWLITIYVKYGVWIYPILDVFNWALITTFISISILVSILLYNLGERVNNFVWSEHLGSLNKKIK